MENVSSGSAPDETNGVVLMDVYVPMYVYIVGGGGGGGYWQCLVDGRDRYEQSCYVVVVNGQKLLEPCDG